MSVIMQGDEYGILIQVELSGGTKVTAETFEDVEIVIGSLIKTLKKNEVTFTEAEQGYIFPITQEESFSFGNVLQKAQIRFKYPNGDVIGVPLGDIDVMKSASKAVL